MTLLHDFEAGAVVTSGRVRFRPVAPVLLKRPVRDPLRADAESHGYRVTTGPGVPNRAIT